MSPRKAKDQEPNLLIEEKEGEKEEVSEATVADEAVAVQDEAPVEEVQDEALAEDEAEEEEEDDEDEEDEDEEIDEQPTRATSPKRPSRPRRRVVRAQARYVRTSARKARMLCGHLRGRSVDEARAILAFAPREVARDWSKLLESAVSNAENNHELLEEDLFVRDAFADEGPTIKRFRPRAMGRATPIHKRTSHLTITLTSYDD